MINRSLRALAVTTALLSPTAATAAASAQTSPRTLPAVLGHPTHTVRVNRHRLTALHTDGRRFSTTLHCPC